jgi:ribosomal protein L22
MKCRERQKEKYASQKSRSEEPTKTRKIDDSIEMDSTESKIIMISDEINNRKLVTEQREDNENEEDDPNQLQW